MTEVSDTDATAGDGSRQSGQLNDGTVWELSGAPGNPVVVLVHGIGLNRQIWRAFLPALIADYQVLSYDLPGHGDSLPAAHSLSLSSLAGQLLGLMDALSIERASIVGFSLGGMINRRFAMDNPARTERLVIFNSPHRRAVDEQQRVEERAAQTLNDGVASTLDASLARWFTADFMAANPAVVAQVTQWMLAVDPVSFAQVRMVLACGVNELVAPVNAFAGPVLVLTSAFDSGSTPAMSHAIAAELLLAETCVVPGLQHLGLLEQPDRFIEPLLGFLARPMPGSSKSG